MFSCITEFRPKFVSHYQDALRTFCLDLLFKLIGWLSHHKLSHAEEDTAELTDNRKGLRIGFTFGGQQHEITLPYNPYRLSHRKIIAKETPESDPVLEQMTSLPGLDDFLFTREHLEHIYDRKLGVVEFETSEEFDD